MKTATMNLGLIKDPDGFNELAHDLKYEQFEKENSEMDEDELADNFYDDVVSKHFEYGEYANIEIIVDEDFNIVGGKISKPNR